MRPVKFKKYFKGEISKEPETSGIFHCWGSSYEEFETGAGNFSVALVELVDGTIEEVLPECLRFVDNIEELCACANCGVVFQQRELIFIKGTESFLCKFCFDDFSSI